MALDKNIFRIEHVIECIEKIEYITNDLTYEEYLEDWIKQDAILRNIEIIGEAISHIDEKLKVLHPEVAWLQAKGMRNILIHEYFRVDFDAVWNTLKLQLPILKFQMIAILKELK
jgi:uncharacterized protein with HEPN domain